MDFESVDFKNNFAEWQSGSAFNTYWQYSYVNRSAFYANISGTYRQYMVRWVQNSLWWYDGWVPYFHNNSQGIFSTKLATALVNGTAKKVVGGRIYFKTKNKEKLVKDDKGEYKINKALAFITSEWSDKAGFAKEVKKAITFSASAGFSLLKIDKQDEGLTVKALRADSFYPVIGFNGEIVELTCFIRDFTNLTGADRNNTQHFSNYYVVEYRFFGDYKRFDGSIIHNAPQVRYEIRETTGTITTGTDYDGAGQKVEFASLPKAIRSKIGKAFSGIRFDTPVLLPFNDNLGAEIINWSDCVSALPELPFGDGLLTNILPYLQSYDYYWSAFNTDMYLGRGRVLVDKEMQSPQAKANNVNYNSGLDSMLFTQIRTNNGVGDKMQPTPIQFDLRSQSWEQIRTMIIQNIAINTGLNLASIASFLNDTNSARTAREISTEESETALFVDDKREILERPINKLLKTITLYYGYEDDVVLRWSSAGLTNVYARSEMLATGLASGFISPQKAVQMFNQDLDEYQLQEEFDNIQAEQDKRQQQQMPFGGQNFNDKDYFGGGDEDKKEQPIPEPFNGALTDEDGDKQTE